MSAPVRKFKIQVRCPRCGEFHGGNWRAKQCWQRQRELRRFKFLPRRKNYVPGRPIGGDGKPTTY